MALLTSPQRSLLQYLGLKLGRVAVIFFLVTAATFIMLDILPGDMSYILAGEEGNPEDIQAIRKELGLDRPVLVRYLEWLANAFRGELGKSWHTEEPVFSAIMNRFPVTFELILLSQILALLLAVPAGIVSAYKDRTGLDRAISGTAFATLSIPVFVMSLLMIFLFALHWHLLPATGYTPFLQNPSANIRGFILPALSLALVEWAPMMRILRGDMISTLREDYILTARAKGLSIHKILFKHAFKPSSLSLITVIGLHIGNMIGGSIIVETIFALPGMGRLLINSIYTRDTFMVQGCILVVTVGYIVIHFAVDALYLMMDPRIRLERGHE